MFMFNVYLAITVMFTKTSVDGLLIFTLFNGFQRSQTL
jgi:hypothetical protein